MNGVEFAAVERRRQAGEPVVLPPMPTDAASLRGYGAAVTADDILAHLERMEERAAASPTWSRRNWAVLLAMLRQLLICDRDLWEANALEGDRDATTIKAGGNVSARLEADCESGERRSRLAVRALRGGA